MADEDKIVAEILVAFTSLYFSDQILLYSTQSKGQTNGSSGHRPSEYHRRIECFVVQIMIFLEYRI